MTPTSLRTFCFFHPNVSYVAPECQWGMPKQRELEALERLKLGPGTTLKSTRVYSLTCTLQ